MNRNQKNIPRVFCEGGASHPLALIVVSPWSAWPMVLFTASVVPVVPMVVVVLAVTISSYSGGCGSRGHPHPVHVLVVPVLPITIVSFLVPSHHPLCEQGLAAVVVDDGAWVVVFL
jgi:hypothetical protein